MGSVFKLRGNGGTRPSVRRWTGEMARADRGSSRCGCGITADGCGDVVCCWICAQIRGIESVDGWEGVSNFEIMAWRE